MKVDKFFLQPAFVLHTRSYRETSLLVDFFTLDCGRISAVAKGARRRCSIFKGILSPFVPLLAGFSGNGELKILVKAETEGARYELINKALFSGLYLNELLMRVLLFNEAYPELYLAYQRILGELATLENLEENLRRFEKTLLVTLGYGLQLNCTAKNEPILEQSRYGFKFGVGIFRFDGDDNGDSFLGSSLLALEKGELTTVEALRDAKRLLRLALKAVLGNKTIKSRELFI
jgi:DNA repair protein RecO